MTAQLLAIKLHIPPLRSEILARPALVERLNRGLERKFTLVSAPAGFGKTTLLSAWAHTRPRVAWVSLDKEENDPKRFWAYFFAALARLEIGIAYPANPQRQVQERLTELINGVAASDQEPFAVVLDDYHLVESKEVHADLIYLMDHCPPGMHLVIATRSDPPFPLGRWRGRGELNEIRAADLRFTLAEAIDLFNRTLGLSLSDANIQTLERRTEGWIAGLQMAAISIRGRLQTQPAQGLQAFIDAFAGSHRFVLDYLVEEVVDQQDERVREFLLKTAILDRFSAPLCQALTGCEDSQEILETLARTNIFLAPLDEQGIWYRYHHLFGDLLRSLLASELPGLIPLLHTQASAWYESNGWLAEAVKHALQLDDSDRFARLIVGNPGCMVYLAELSTIERWLGKLPAESVCKSPWLCIAHAWVKAYLGDYESTGVLLNQAENAIVPWVAAHQLGAQDEDELHAHMAMVECYRDYFLGENLFAIQRLQAALPDLATSAIGVRSYASGLLGALLRSTGQLKEADRYLSEAVRLSQETRFDIMTADALTDLCSLRIMQGRFREGIAIAEKALILDERHYLQFGTHLLTIGRIHYHLGNIYFSQHTYERSVFHLNLALDVSQKWGKADDVAVCYSGLVWSAYGMGDIDQAWDAVRKTKQVASSISPYWERLGNLVEARLHLYLGDVDEASRIVQACGLLPDDPVDFSTLSEYLFLARLLIAQKNFMEAQRLLDRMMALAEPVEANMHVLPILVAQGMALAGLGQAAAARQCLQRALVQAASENWVQIFLSFGESIVPLLQSIPLEGAPQSFLAKILGVLAESPQGGIPGAELAADLAGSLSSRELEVLQLLATPASHAQIAEQLYISRNTVRSHIKRIYQKLQANNRIQAIEQAKALGLIP